MMQNFVARLGAGFGGFGQVIRRAGGGPWRGRGLCGRARFAKCCSCWVGWGSRAPGMGWASGLGAGKMPDGCPVG